MLKQLLLVCLLLLIISGISAGLFYYITYLPHNLMVPEKYSTIQQAVNKSRPKDTVIVAAGTYRENITANKAIQIHGQDGEQTIINGSLTIDTRDCQKDPNSKTIIRNLTFQDSESNSVTFIGSEILIENCIIKDSNNIGIMLSDCKTATVTNCQVSGCSNIGIFLDNVDVLSLIKNTSQNNKGTGFSVQTAKQCLLNGNTATSNIWDGIFLTMTNLPETTLENNWCENNQRNGIHLHCKVHEDPNNLNPADTNESSKTKVTISNNTCSSNTYSGICTGYWESPFIIEQNTCHKNAWAGIQLVKTENCYLSGNMANENKLGGIFIEHAGETIVKENSCNNNDSDVGGIFIKYSGKITAEKNSCNKNKASGITLFECDKSTVRDNKVSENGKYGLYLGGLEFDIEKNYCRKNKLSGIFTYNENSNDIKNDNLIETKIISNICEDNSEWGITTKQLPYKTNVLENTCNCNGKSGIYINCSYDVSITKNKCEMNNEAGIYALECDKGLILENTLLQNKYSGIVSCKTKCLIEKNTSQNNKQYGIYVFDNKEHKVDLEGMTVNNDIVAWETADVKIIQNICENNHLGLKIDRSIRPMLIEDNTFEYNQDNGIELYGIGNVVIENNKINNNSQRGILVRNNYRIATISNNSICHNRHFGIDLQQGGQALIKANKVEGNAYEGLIVYGDPNTMANVIGNTFQSNYTSGMIFINGAAGEIRDNTCKDHPWSGIAIRGEGTNPIVSGNHCTNNKCWGILSWAGAEPKIEDNNITENNGIGGVKQRGKFNLYDTFMDRYQAKQ